MKQLLTTVILYLAGTAVALAFGGEDVVNGSPWHHEDITMRALAGPYWYEQTGFPSASECPDSPHAIAGGPDYETAGFSVAAACAVAWHADYLDAYLYNPIFWAQGVWPNGLDRFKAAMVGHPELIKLHFDDTFTTSGILDNYQRYASGTLIGLYWASLQNGGRGDVASAHNVLGVSVHAIEDFYAHSNWVDDPERRCQTFLQTPVDRRNAMTLYAGAYELPESLAPHHHGAYSPSCSLLRGDKIDPMLDLICTGYSPFQNSPVCEGWRMCRNGTAVTVSGNGVEIASQVHLGEKGIALDTTWMARIDAVNRGLVDENQAFLPGKDGMHFPTRQCVPIVNARRDAVCETDTDLVFAGAKDLAIRGTVQWLDFIEKSFSAIGPQQAAFWARVKSEGSTPADRQAAFEDFSKLPYTFLSAGPYPVGNASAAEHDIIPSSEGWYLRTRIRTLNALGAGTDSDIYAEVGGPGFTERQLLDRLPGENILEGYNDFEMGDDDVYLLGPFPARPTSLKLVNDDSGAAAVLEALWDDFASRADAVITSMRQTLISLIAGQADYVGTTTGFLRAATIRPWLADRFHDAKLHVDGGDQGIFDVSYRIRPTPWVLTAQEAAGDWQAFEVQVRSIISLKESLLDRGSGGDEPFVIFLISPLNGLKDQTASFLSTPVEDMQKGQEHFFPRVTGSSKIMKVPPHGGVVLSVRVFESDSENLADRVDLQKVFESGMDAEARAAAARFDHELGRALIADWTIQGLDIFAFARGAVPEAGTVLTANAVGEIKGGAASQTFALAWDRVRPLATGQADVRNWAAAPPGVEVLQGKWYALGYECDDEVSPQEIDVTEKDGVLTATKTSGDGCVAAGEESWTGKFADGAIDGSLALGRGGGKWHELDPALPPLPADLASDPQAAVLGSWLIEWRNTPRGNLTGQATLVRDAADPDPGQGWLQVWFDQKLDLPDLVANDYLVRPVLIADDGSISLDAGNDLHLCSADITDPEESRLCFLDGRWMSTVTPVADAMRGTWSSQGQSGEETWRRPPASGTLNWIEAFSVDPAGLPMQPDKTDGAAPGERPVRISLEKGGRVAYIDLQGDDLWQHHDVWLASATGIDVFRIPGRASMADGWYLCAKAVAEPGGNPQFSLTQNYFSECYRRGGVKGFRVGLRLTPEVSPGLYTLFVDDHAIPFILEAAGEHRPLRLALQSCSVLREVDGANPGLTFLRANPAPEAAPTANR